MTNIFYDRLDKTLQLADKDTYNGIPTNFDTNHNLAAFYYSIDKALEKTYTKRLKDKFKFNILDAPRNELLKRYDNYTGVVKNYLLAISFITATDDYTSQQLLRNILKKIEGIFYFKGGIDIYKILILETFNDIDNLFVEPLFYNTVINDVAHDFDSDIFDSIPTTECLTSKQIFLLNLASFTADISDLNADMQNKTNGNESIYYDYLINELYNDQINSSNNATLKLVWKKLKQIINDNYLITSYYQIRLTNPSASLSTRVVDEIIRLINPTNKIYVGTITEILQFIIYNYNFRYNIKVNSEFDYPPFFYDFTELSLAEIIDPHHRWLFTNNFRKYYYFDADFQFEEFFATRLDNNLKINNKIEDNSLFILNGITAEFDFTQDEK